MYIGDICEMEAKKGRKEGMDRRDDRNRRGRKA